MDNIFPYIFASVNTVQVYVDVLSNATSICLKNCLEGNLCRNHLTAANSRIT